MQTKKIKAIALLASAIIASPLYGKDDAAILNFKSNNRESAEVLKSEIPTSLSSKLEDIFDIVETSKFNQKMEELGLGEFEIEGIKENYPGLDYVIAGDYSIIGNSISINSRVISIDDNKKETQRAEGSMDDVFKVIDIIANEIKEDIGITNDLIQERPLERKGGVKIDKEDAPTAKDRYIGLSLGVSMPNDNREFKDFYSNAVSLGIESGVFKKNLVLGFPFIGYRVFTPDWDEVLVEMKDVNFDVIKGGSISLLNISAAALYRINPNANESLTPYVRAIGGYYKGKTGKIKLTIEGEEETIFNGDSENGFGFSIGGGLESRLSDKFSIKGELDYEKVFFKEDLGILSVGIVVNYYRK